MVFIISNFSYVFLSFIMLHGSCLSFLLAFFCFPLRPLYYRPYIKLFLNIWIINPRPLLHHSLLFSVSYVFDSLTFMNHQIHDILFSLKHHLQFSSSAYLLKLIQYSLQFLLTVYNQYSFIYILYCANTLPPSTLSLSVSTEHLQIYIVIHPLHNASQYLVGQTLLEKYSTSSKLP